MVKTGAPFSDHSKLRVDSTTPGSVLPGVAGGGVNGRGEPNAPAPLGEIFRPGDGLGVGVVVETSIGVGAGVAVSSGVGVAAKVNAAAKNAPRPSPPTRSCFGIQIGSDES